MGLEEEKVEVRQKEPKPQPNHRMLFGVPVIIEENSSENNL